MICAVGFGVIKKTFYGTILVADYFPETALVFNFYNLSFKILLKDIEFAWSLIVLIKYMCEDPIGIILFSASR